MELTPLVKKESFKQDPLEDDSKEPELLLVTHRLPWLAVGIIGGMLTTIFASRFESLLSRNINLFFLRVASDFGFESEEFL